MNSLQTSRIAFAVVASKIDDGLEIRREAACKSHKPDVALGLPLHPPIQLNAIHITVDVNL
jgi:hypothetical protein